MKYLPLLLLSISLHAITIQVTNDSSYTLHATIYSASDAELSSLVLSPKNTITWQDSFFDARDYAEGPFKVVFTCPDGDEYGTVTRIAQNATVRAQAARGPKRCGRNSQPDPHRDLDQAQPHHKY